MYKLTIVVPVYNSEAFVSKALESLPLRDDVEVIIIDDCSTDGTYEICKKFAEEHNCKLLKNTNNCGVGYSKNKGYSMAQGEYIVTVDSDDWCNTKDYNKAINILYNLGTPDRVVFPVEYNDGSISDGTVRTATWGQFIRKGFLEDNNLNFDPGHRRAEDWFLRIVYDRIPHRVVRLTNICPYHYNNDREGSLTWEWKKNGSKD